jgi:hypothetical protein
MNKRIKIVWGLSFVTMLLIFGGQVYWLYNQYIYNSQECISQLNKDCREIFEAEGHQRSDIREKRRSKTKGDSDLVTISVRSQVYMFSKLKNKMVADLCIRSKNITKRVYLKNTSYDVAAIYAEMYLLSKDIPLRAQAIDSLLQKRGYGSIRNARFVRSERIYKQPVVQLIGNSTGHCRVIYSNNPVNMEAFVFDVDIPTKAIIRNMAWQLVGSLLLLLILAFCLFYQMRTIVIQKRIDRLRQEFMKNMIYEMKQPPVGDTAAEISTKIGHTDFFYSLNELRIGNERVIITSRQAEILKLLTDTPNEVVSRTDILNQIWGDDSYANSMALNVQITYLRRALKSDESVSIEAVMKKGYVLKEQQL